MLQLWFEGTMMLNLSGRYLYYMIPQFNICTRKGNEILWNPCQSSKGLKCIDIWNKWVLVWFSRTVWLSCTYRPRLRAEIKRGAATWAWDVSPGGQWNEDLAGLLGVGGRSVSMDVTRAWVGHRSTGTLSFSQPPQHQGVSLVMSALVSGLSGKVSVLMCEAVILRVQVSPSKTFWHKERRELGKDNHQQWPFPSLKQQHLLSKALLYIINLSGSY